MKKLVVLTGIALAAAVVNEKLKDATRPHISHIQISSEGKQTQEFAVRGFVKGTSFKVEQEPNDIGDKEEEKIPTLNEAFDQACQEIKEARK